MDKDDRNNKISTKNKRYVLVYEVKDIDVKKSKNEPLVIIR